jgi:hypothetical protein
MIMDRHDFHGDTCNARACREAQGWQCAECGHYFPRNQIKDIGGEYYCRDNQGHNKAALTNHHLRSTS